jgi:hypothetical protein
MSQREYKIVLGVDAGAMDPGISAALAKEKHFAEETKALNADVAKAKSIYHSVEDQGASPATVAAYRKQYEGLRDLRNQKLADSRLTQQLSDIEYRSTHTALQSQLNDRAMYYARLRQMHQGNAAMLARIDKTEAVETARIQKDSRGDGAMFGIHRGTLELGGKAFAVGMAAHTVVAGAELLNATFAALSGNAEATGVALRKLPLGIGELLGLAFDTGERIRRHFDKEYAAEAKKDENSLGIAMSNKAATERMFASGDRTRQMQAETARLGLTGPAAERASLHDKYGEDIRSIKKQLNEASPEGNEHKRLIEEWYARNDLYKEQQAKITRGERESLHPLLAYQSYEKGLDTEVANGLPPEDRDQMLASRLRSMIGTAGQGGRFEDASTHWKSTQSALLSDGNIPLEQLQETRKLLPLLAQILARLNRPLKVGAN